MPSLRYQFRVTLIAIALSQLCPTFIWAQQTIITTLPAWAENRVFSFSTEGPITTSLASFDGVAESTKIVLNHFAHVEKAILTALRNRQPYGEDDLLRPCNFEFKDWFKSVLVYFFHRNLTQPDISCITDLHGTVVAKDEEPLYSDDQLFDALQRRGDALKPHARDLADKLLGNWSNPDVIYNFSVNMLSRRCIVHSAGAMRVNDYWYMRTSLTSSPNHIFLTDFQRQFISEYVRVDENGNFAPPLRYTLESRPEKNSNQSNRIVISGTTTELSSWTGTAEPSQYTRILSEDNLAIVDALDGIDVYVQQAEDAMTVSGIAILVLPLGFNLIPISLLTQVSGVKVLLYTLLSDVLTVIPLAIKGGELIQIGKKRVRRVAVRITSGWNASMSETSAGELWAAECRSNEDVLTAGIAFLSLATTFMVVGVAAEIGAF